MEPLAAGDPRQVGGYRLHSRLGAGGMGRVFLGFSPAGRAVAVKVVHPEFARDPEFVRRFGREVRAAETVSGAFTAPVVAAGPDDDPPWLATAYVAGPSLAEVIAQAGPLPEGAVWRLAGGLIEALQAIHARGLVHRDLKPANVLLAVDGPRVIDFGISRALDGTAVTASRIVLGTPAFMSPEQAEGSPAGPPSDVFSLGCVIAFAATGSAPFGAGDPVAIAYRVVHAQPDLTAVPAQLRGLVAGCLAKDPAQRSPLAWLMDAVLAGSAPYPGASAASFWPDPVAGLIGAQQASLRAQVQRSAEAAPLPTASVPYEPAVPATSRPGRQDADSTRTAAPQRRGDSAGHLTSPIGPTGESPPGTTRPPRSRFAMRGTQLIAAFAAAAVIGALAAFLVVPARSHPPAGSPSHTPAPSGAARPSQATAHSSYGTTSPAAAPLTVVTVCTYPAVTGNCTGPYVGSGMKVQPTQIVTSADGSGYVKDITWSDWGNATATGTGTLEVDNCTPNCAQGTYTGYPATVTVSGLSPYGSKAEAYSQMVVRAPTSPYPPETFSSGLVP